MRPITLFLIFMGYTITYSQEIFFTGCPSLFESQEYIFRKTGTDAFNKGIYETTPLDGQACGGLGTCEFRIQWNNNLNRWEFLADEGYGTFTQPYLIYYNSTGDNTANNPPANDVGEWIENLPSTPGECGSSLTTTNSSLSGDVHTINLEIDDIDIEKISIFPNPTAGLLTISGIENGKTIEIYNTLGQLIISIPFQKNINTQSLNTGIYLLKIKGNTPRILQTKFVKK